MLISCQLIAEGAVRRPSGRLIPKAAQSKFDSVCGESVLEPNSRVDLRSLRISIRGRPPVVCGGGSWTGLSACAAEIPQRQIVISRSLNRKGDLCFMGTSCGDVRRRGIRLSAHGLMVCSHLALFLSSLDLRPSRSLGCGNSSSCGGLHRFLLGHADNVLFLPAVPPHSCPSCFLSSHDPLPSCRRHSAP